ncbi:MAG: htrB [Gammaproteobacteria bacterium]|jgi:KDO2-lipid IV(A) lauroyltransferase|nr:htrB [Gammaproteobacteria bacterium]
MMNVSYWVFRVLTYPLSFLPNTWLHVFGRGLGTAAYYLVPTYRKRCLSNLALATSLHLSNDEIQKLAKQSLQNVMIGLLEYAKLFRLKNIAQIATCDNPEVADNVMAAGKGMVVFCGHQANWEVLFLYGTSRYPGVAIGRPIRNTAMYQFVLAVREKFGGKIIPPKKALWEGIRALKRGAFLGVVGDQGMVESGFSCDFFGRKAWFSTLPALLSYRTGAPLVVAMTRREQGQYVVKYGKPIYPNTAISMDEEVQRMMSAALQIFEQSVRERPGEWFWQHNVWKQQGLGRPRGIFRQDCLAIILPENAAEIFPVAQEIRKRYPTEFVTLFVPANTSNLALSGVETVIYHSLQDILVDDYRFKIIFDLSSNPAIRKHFLRFSAVDVIPLKGVAKLIENKRKPR